MVLDFTTLISSTPYSNAEPSNAPTPKFTSFFQLHVAIVPYVVQKICLNKRIGRLGIE